MTQRFPIPCACCGSPIRPGQARATVGAVDYCTPLCAAVDTADRERRLTAANQYVLPGMTPPANTQLRLYED